jgi:small subunit ribosomal protein S24e
LARKQFIVDVLHPSRPNVSKTEISEKLATIYKVDKARVVAFGFKTTFGGGRSTGFALIYDDEVSQKKFEPRHRLVSVRNFLSILITRLLIDDLQSGLATKKEKATRKLRKERKNRAKKVCSCPYYKDALLMNVTFSCVVPRSSRLQRLQRRANSGCAPSCVVLAYYVCTVRICLPSMNHMYMHKALNPAY